ncbi:MAG: hypothetical protein J0H73_05295 [Salana multivorans]|uniref:phage tail terminator protein n=1 Tax=Salana multivorans TaxID=120377 RepID=UPI0009678B0B|nr:minor capsid protein [Salana multivorans]MBN8881713.1 hypothetical protein [Salana multivorans]OJX98673.1 MAG: hypothetical protein BGO96_04655 [Micrococcales bacterium 73-15]
MTATATILTAAAQQLHAAGVGIYRTNGRYSADETGIVLKTLPTEPDRVIALSTYQVDPDPDPNAQVDVAMLQIRTRGIPNPPTDVDDLAEAAVAALTGHHQDWPGLRIQRAHTVSTLPLGADQNRRQERTDNLRLLILR